MQLVELLAVPSPDSLTICNRTNIPSHVSLDQVGRLAVLTNWLLPGQCVVDNQLSDADAC
jgi:hypothetical protein